MRRIWIDDLQIDDVRHDAKAIVFRSFHFKIPRLLINHELRTQPNRIAQTLRLNRQYQLQTGRLFGPTNTVDRHHHLARLCNERSEKSNRINSEITIRLLTIHATFIVHVAKDIRMQKMSCRRFSQQSHLRIVLGFRLQNETINSFALFILFDKSNLKVFVDAIYSKSFSIIKINCCVLL